MTLNPAMLAWQKALKAAAAHRILSNIGDTRSRPSSRA